MRKFFSLVVASILATTSLFAAEVTVTKTIAEVQAYNNWETQYVDANGFWHRTWNLDENIQFAALPESPESSSTQNGILFLNTTTSVPSDWRVYQARGAFQIIAAEGCVLKSATFTFKTKNAGDCLQYGGTNYASGDKITFDGTKALEEIAVFTTTSGKTNGQARISNFTVVYEKKETPTPATKTIYCKMEQGWWKADGAAVGCHSWGTPGPGTTWPGVRMTPVEGQADLWSIDLDLNEVQNVIFTRVNGSGDIADWGAKTKDLTIPVNENNLFTITSSSAVWGDPGCDGEWSVYVPTVQKYYVTGNAALVGKDKEWAANAIELKDGSYTFEKLAAGDYQMKVTQGDWEKASYGFAALSKESSKNIYDADGNIRFILAEEGDVTVAFADEKVTVTGTFVPATTTYSVEVPEETPNCFIAGSFNKWTFQPMNKVDETHYTLTLEGEFQDSVYKYTCGKDWKYVEVIDANRTYSKSDEVSEWTRIPGDKYSDIYSTDSLDVVGEKVVKASIVCYGDTFPAYKVGTSTKDTRVCTITVPAGTKNLHLHAAGWQGKNVTLTITGVAKQEITLSNDNAVSGDIKTTTVLKLEGDPESFYKVIEVNAAAETTITITGSERYLLFGANAEGGYVAPKYYIAGSMTKWAKDMVLLEEVGKDSLSAKIDLEADSLYQFKVVKVQDKDTTWYGMNEAATMELGNSTGWWLYTSVGEANQANVGLQTTTDSSYIFYVNLEVKDHVGEPVVSVVIPEPPVTYYLKNNWDNGEWSWLEMKADEEGYVLDSVVFGGTGVNLNTAESDDNAIWFDLKSLKYNDKDTIQALDTVRFELAISEKDTVLTAIVLGRPEQPQPVGTFDLTIVQDTVWSKDGAKIAAWTWGEELAGAWTDWATNNNDTLTLKVDERADSIIFKRFAPEVEVPYWEGTAEYQWNEIAKSEIADCHVFIITNWSEGVWCERPVVETKYYAKNNWDAGEWTWLEMSATDQENFYMLDSVVFGGTGVNINDKEDDTDALWFAADAITVLDGLDGLPGPIPPKPQGRDTIPYAPAHSGVVLEAPQLLAGDTIKLFFNAADSTLKAAIVGRPTPPTPKYYITGNEALCGEKAWDAQAIEMKDSTHTFTAMAAGEYEMKITNGAWDPAGQSWGSAALSEDCSAGVGDKNGNIHFIVETPNNVVVSIANGKVTITGTFKEEPITSGITVNVTVPEGTPACYFYGEMSGNTFVAMDKVDDTHYTTTFAKATSIGWGYLFAWEAGNWNTKNAEGDFTTEPVEGVINVEVKAWVTSPGTEYKYTTYTEWQVKYGPAWEWVNTTKQEDGTFTVEAVWGNTGINIASGENPIKQDWYALDDPALTVEEGVVEGGNVVITLTVVDDETITLNVIKAAPITSGITVNVTVPEGTPACFFYGEMSGNTFVEMDKVDDTHYTTTFAKATSIGWGYLFAWEAGNWNTKNAEGDFTTEPVEGVINVEVKAWVTSPGTEYKYTTYTEWQVKYGPAWEWVNTTKQEDGTFTVEAVWGNTGINIASGENPIKQDWYALDDPALTVEEGVVEGGNVVITLTVVDDETVALNVKKQTATNLNNVKALDGKRYNILGQPVNETYRGIVIMDGQTYLQ